VIIFSLVVRLERVSIFWFCIRLFLAIIFSRFFIKNLAEYLSQ